jgi:polyphosphate kinase 2 (PPK2 family)
MAPLFEQLMVKSGIILLKYWLEVSPEEQTRRWRRVSTTAARPGTVADGRQVL